MSLNKWLGIGNLTRDPELKYTPNGAAVASFGLAVNRVYKDANGDKQQQVTFVDVEAWGKTAEMVTKFFTKGDAILVEGSLELDSWNDKETGQKRSKHKIRALSVSFLPKGKPQGGGDGVPVAAGAESDTGDGDVPF